MGEIYNLLLRPFNKPARFVYCCHYPNVNETTEHTHRKRHISKVKHEKSTPAAVLWFSGKNIWDGNDSSKLLYDQQEGVTVR